MFHRRRRRAERDARLRYGTEPEQFPDAKLIIAWGANIHGTNVHLWPFIVEARRNGAKLVVIDPVKTRTAALADRHLAINPGSDLALALGLIHVIVGENLHDADYIARYTNGFDELAELARAYDPARVAALTGIATEDIVQLAREYAGTRPAVIRLNYGVQRSERGGAAVRAITALPAITGSWREVGGGMQLGTAQAFHFNSYALEMPELQERSALGREARIVNMAELGKALTELDSPPVKAMVVYNSNPACIAPESGQGSAGMRRDDLFTVVLEQFQTDTADYADILLPATTFLEHTDLYLAYGHYHLQLARPRSTHRRSPLNVEVFRDLALRMGFDDQCFRDSEDIMMRSLLGSGHPFLAASPSNAWTASTRFASTSPSPALHSCRSRKAGLALPQASASSAPKRWTIPRRSNRVSETPFLRARYPLELISSKNDDSMNSTFGNRPGVDADTALLHLSVPTPLREASRPATACACSTIAAA